MHEDLVVGRTVHELGAGLGLSGLVAAAAGSKSVVLSDFNKTVCTNMRENILLNDAQETTAGVFLDWCDVASAPDPRASEQVELVIASDVVCQVQDAYNLAATIKRLMLPEGAAVVVLPFPSNRFGTESLAPALEKEGLCFECHELKRAALMVGIEEADYFR